LRELSNTGSGTAGWFVAVVVPESYYTAELVSFEHTFLGVFGVTLALVLSIGGGTLSALRRGLTQVVATTSRMRQFDFSAAAPRSRLREVDDVMLGLERAKTVARAMGKYVPLDLVRGLHERNQEPELGGELRDLTLLFTDIEGFTTLSERLPPDELARRLGDYLEVFTSAIQKTSGTIDKYIGDAVMAFWNAPALVPDPCVRACEAVLECKRAAAALYASTAWAGLPPLTTRFGLHRASVLVGNFGAKSRLAYTALGDGVNLAARLEPLCKQYGVTALVSESVVEAARGAFSFRRIDRVAVKGKSRGIDVFELIGKAGDAVPAHVAKYEQAFEAYLAMDFGAAVSILASQAHDEPSAVLAARCREYAVNPPPSDWNRVHVARAK
jgi:adenylate cyclase